MLIINEKINAWVTTDWFKDEWKNEQMNKWDNE